MLQANITLDSQANLCSSPNTRTTQQSIPPSIGGEAIIENFRFNVIPIELGIIRITVRIDFILFIFNVTFFIDFRVSIEYHYRAPIL